MKKNIHLVELEDRLTRQRAEAHPNVPPHAQGRVKLSDTTANGLTKCIIIFLQSEGWQAERISTEGRVVKVNRKRWAGGQLVDDPTYKRINTSGTRGSADISATIKGRSVKIEVKIGHDRQSEYQKEYQRKVESAGGYYIIAKSFGGFYDDYQRLLSNMEG